jgi:hypothetical protein
MWEQMSITEIKAKREAQDFSEEELENKMYQALDEVEDMLLEYSGGDYGPVFKDDFRDYLYKVKFKLNRRLRSVAGKYRRNRRTKNCTIELHPECESVMDTLRHEALHLLTGLRDTKDFERLCNEFNIDFRHNETYSTMEDYKYILKCTECGRTVLKRKRMSKYIRHYDWYKSGCCNANMKLIKKED